MNSLTKLYKSSNKALDLFWILVFFGFTIIRFGYAEKLDRFGAYASYFFEVFFIVLIFISFKNTISLKISVNNTKEFLVKLFFSLLFGLGTYAICLPLKILIPFDLNATETLVFLLIIAPILEELLFRMAYWELLLKVRIPPAAVLLITSVMFSFSHFSAWWVVPKELRSFVLYQALYTFLLALYCGWLRMKSNSATTAILSHFVFNLGFYMGSYL